VNGLWWRYTTKWDWPLLVIQRAPIVTLIDSFGVISFSLGCDMQSLIIPLIWIYFTLIILQYDKTLCAFAHAKDGVLVSEHWCFKVLYMIDLEQCLQWITSKVNSSKFWMLWWQLRCLFIYDRPVIRNS
jgi:hypothetical protein